MATIIKQYKMKGLFYMLKSIKAEFEQFDSAEIASRKIRKNVSGIRKIKITSHRMSKSSTDNSYFRLIPTAVTTQNYITLSVNSTGRNLIEPKTIQTTLLTVICTEEVSARVHSIITSSGGISISSETFIP